MKRFALFVFALAVAVPAAATPFNVVAGKTVTATTDLGVVGPPPLPPHVDPIAPLAPLSSLVDGHVPHRMAPSGRPAPSGGTRPIPARSITGSTSSSAARS